MVYEIGHIGYVLFLSRFNFQVCSFTVSVRVTKGLMKTKYGKLTLHTHIGLHTQIIKIINKKIGSLFTHKNMLLELQIWVFSLIQTHCYFILTRLVSKLSCWRLILWIFYIELMIKSLFCAQSIQASYGSSFMLSNF